jgi:hypothetical protein
LTYAFCVVIIYLTITQEEGTMTREEFEKEMAQLGTNRVRAIAEGWLPLTHAEFNAWGFPNFTSPPNMEGIEAAIAAKKSVVPIGKAVAGGRNSRRFSCGCEWNKKKGFVFRCGQNHGETIWG